MDDLRQPSPNVEPIPADFMRVSLACATVGADDAFDRIKARLASLVAHLAARDRRIEQLEAESVRDASVLLRVECGCGDIRVQGEMCHLCGKCQMGCCFCVSETDVIALRAEIALLKRSLDVMVRDREPSDLREQLDSACALIEAQRVALGEGREREERLRAALEHLVEYFIDDNPGGVKADSHLAALLSEVRDALGAK